MTGTSRRPGRVGMGSITFALLGLAVIGALFAGIYYAPRNVQPRQTGAPAFQLAPGEAKQTVVQPTLAGTPIVVHLIVTGSPIDVYVMQKDWSDQLAGEGELRLDQPFSYLSSLSRFNVTGATDIPLVSDGSTAYVIIFDASDSYYDGDTPAGPTGSGVQLTKHYVESESRSLVFGYIATLPSILLVALTLGRRILRWRRRRATHP